MLRKWLHSQFAFQLNPERERRLACFANTNDDDENNGESPEELPEQPEQQELPLEGVQDAIRQSTQSEVLKLLPREVARDAIYSPALLAAIQRAGLVPQDAQLAFRERITELNDGGEKVITPSAERCAKVVELLFNHPSHLVALTEIYDNRIANYEGLTIPKTFGQVEARWVALTNAASLSEAMRQLVRENRLNEFEDIVRELDIDAEKLQQFRAEHNLTVHSREQVIFAAIESFEHKQDRIRRKQTHDVSIHYDKDPEATTESLKTMSLSIKDALLGSLQTRAKHLRRHFDEKLGDIEGKMKLSALNACRRFGISTKAYYQTIYNAAQPLIGIEEQITELQQQAQYERDLTLEQRADPDVENKHNFINQARSLEQKLEDMLWLQEKSSEEALTELLSAQVDEHQRAKDWVIAQGPRYQRTAERLRSDAQVRSEFVETVLNGDEAEADEFISNLERIGRLGERFENKADDEDAWLDYETLYDFLDDHRREQLETLVGQCEQGSERALVAEFTERRKEEIDDKDALRLQEMQLHDQLEARIQHCSTLDHEVSKTMNLRGVLTAALQENVTLLRIRDNENMSEEGRQRINDMLHKITMDRERITQCITELEQLDESHANTRIVSCNTKEEYEQHTKLQNRAGYRVSTGKIYINEQQITEDEHSRDESLHHELGHAIVDTVARRTKVVPQIFREAEEFLQQTPANETETMMDVLQRKAEDWGIEQLREGIYEQELAGVQQETFKPSDPETAARQRTEQKIRELLIDELFAKRASLMRKRAIAMEQKKPLPEAADKEIKELFALFDELEEAPIAHINKPKPLPKEDFAVLQETDDDTTTEDSGDAAPEDETPKTDESGDEQSMFQNLYEEASGKVGEVRDFVRDHPSIPGHSDWVVWVQDAEDTLNKVVEKHAQDPALAEEQMQEFIKLIAPEVESVGQYKSQELDLTGVAATGRSAWVAFRENVTFVNVYDLWNMVKSGAEDIQRMWKRRGEQVQAQVGENLTNWIPQWVPYAGQLQHEFHRRADNSEQEEVKQWQDAFAETDSYALLELFKTVNNKDQMKAMLELLTERGFMDWNNEGFWDALNRLSRYQMPKYECRNNDILRDKWLLKLITDIWDDKDHYYEWRRKQDSNYDSKMGDFTALVDQLSNVSGGLNGELQRMLILWERFKDSGDIPNEINPHKYEKILKYSIANGKMSMEHKFYYLVQGIASGLISIDRLRVLAGEEGGILNQFPFIDYFYGVNNTQQDMIELARILETDSHAPDDKTTMWLYTHMSRSGEAMSRVQKATSGTRAEALDHEDLPMIMAFADVDMINRTHSQISGDRHKVSTEGMKNAYAGFGSKFLTLARFVQQGGKLKTRDGIEMARGLAAYLHMDNLSLQNSNDGKNRPTLDWTAMDTDGPSTGGVSVRDVRAGNHGLAKRVFTDFGILNNFESITGTKYEDYFKDPDLPDFDPRSKKDALMEKNFHASNKLQQALIKELSSTSGLQKIEAILKDPAIVNNLVAEHNREIEPDKAKKYMGLAGIPTTAA